MWFSACYNILPLTLLYYCTFCLFTTDTIWEPYGFVCSVLCRDGAKHLKDVPAQQSTISTCFASAYASEICRIGTDSFFPHHLVLFLSVRCFKPEFVERACKKWTIRATPESVVWTPCIVLYWIAWCSCHKSFPASVLLLITSSWRWDGIRGLLSLLMGLQAFP